MTTVALALALVLAIVLVGAIMQRVTGLGFALVASPFIVLMLGAVSGVMVVNACGVAVAAILTVRSFRDVDWRKCRILVAGALVGVVPGAILVRTMPHAWLEIVVGLLILVAVVSSLFIRAQVSAKHPLPLWVSGMASGVMNAMAGVGGPPLGIYGVMTRWEPRSFAATMQPCLFVIGLLSLMAKVVLSGSPAPVFDLWVWAALFGAAALGIIVGEVLSPRVSPRASRALLVSLAILGAITVLVRGIMDLA